jgi:hypothetical protein
VYASQNQLERQTIIVPVATSPCQPYLRAIDEYVIQLVAHYEKTTIREFL